MSERGSRLEEFKKHREEKKEEKEEMIESSYFSEKGVKHNRFKIFDINKPRPQPDKTKEYKTSFRQVLSYLLVPFRWMFISTLLLSILQSILFLALPVLGGDIMTQIVEERNFNAILDNFVLLFAALLMMALVAYLRLYMNQFMGNSIIRSLRGELFRSIQGSSYSFLDHHATGDLMSRCTSDLNTLKMLLSSQITYFIRQCLTVLMALVAMFFIDPVLSLFILPIFPIIFFVIYRFKKRIGPLYKESREIYGDEVTATVEENIGGVRVVRAFATEDYEIEKFNKLNDKYLDKQKDLMRLQVSFEPIVRLLVNFAMAVVIFFGGSMLGRGELYLGDLFSYLMLLNFAIDPLFFINTFLGNTAMYLQTTNRICEILNNDQIIQEPNENRVFVLTDKGKEFYQGLIALEKIKESSEGRHIFKRKNVEENPDNIKNCAHLNMLDEDLRSVILNVGNGVTEWKKIQKNMPGKKNGFLKNIWECNPDLLEFQGAKWLDDPKGAVKFDNVSLSYRNDDFHELQNINFETKPGEVIAILGATGSGKTSIIRLIGRFYENDEGTITIDGTKIRDITKKDLRALIGFVPQESFLFSTSLKENLSIGRQDYVKMEEIIEACKLANIHEFINNLPKGYETVVGQRGVTLSGGQRQRLSIARALIKKPKILILDDATSSVDVDTEYNIQKSFRTMFSTSTTFIITQRLSSVRYADKILVLEKGRIQQCGSHDELMADKQGIYHKLYTTLKVDERAQV